jgi:hypothetical protein
VVSWIWPPSSGRKATPKRDGDNSFAAVAIVLMLSASLAFMSSASGRNAWRSIVQSIKRAEMQSMEQCLLWPTNATTTAGPIHAEEIGYSCSAPLTFSDY